MRSRIWIVILFSLLSLEGCSGLTNSEPITMEDAMKVAEIHYEVILHKEEAPDKEFGYVFYRVKDMLGFGLLETNRKAWEWKVGTEQQIGNEGVTWSYSNANEQLPIIWGSIQDDSITAVTVEVEGVSKAATVLEHTEERLWYLLLDGPQAPPVTIIGTDAEGEIKFKYGE